MVVNVDDQQDTNNIDSGSMMLHPPQIAHRALLNRTIADPSTLIFYYSVHYNGGQRYGQWFLLIFSSRVCRVYDP